MDPNNLNQDVHDDTSEDAKRLMFITDVTVLNCQNNGCGNPLKVPIKQCSSGHLFCSNCHQGHLNCMLCPKNVLFPAPSVDAILNSIMDVCPYKYQGCNEEFPFHDLVYHVEERCKYNDLTCPIPHCYNRSASGYDLEKHLTRIHKTYVESFRFGLPAHFAFKLHSDTRILIESNTKQVFILSYMVGRDATIFKLFCVNFCCGLQFTYRITDRMGVTALLDDTPVPITTFKEGLGAVGLGGSLSHQLRTGKKFYLYCTFVITIKCEPEN